MGRKDRSLYSLLNEVSQSPIRISTMYGITIAPQNNLGQVIFILFLIWRIIFIMVKYIFFYQFPVEHLRVPWRELGLVPL